jgi:alginate O-acetyltransferase complex protein AlgI
VVPPLVTMLVSGIWHGTGWNFIAWGLFHGVVIACSQLLLRPSAARPGLLQTAGSWLTTNTLLLFSWVLFRAVSLDWLGKVLFQSPFISGTSDLAVCLASFSFVLFYLLLYLAEFCIHRWSRETAWARTFFYAAVTILIFIFSNSVAPDFIYTHF